MQDLVRAIEDCYKEVNHSGCSRKAERYINKFINYVRQKVTSYHRGTKSLAEIEQFKTQYFEGVYRAICDCISTTYHSQDVSSMELAFDRAVEKEFGLIEKRMNEIRESVNTDLQHYQGAGCGLGC